MTGAGEAGAGEVGAGEAGAGGAGPSVDRGKSVSTPIDYHDTGYQPVWPSSHMPVRAAS